MLFNVYVKPLGERIGVRSHRYVGDTLLCFFLTAESGGSVGVFSRYMEKVVRWMRAGKTGTQS